MGKLINEITINATVEKIWSVLTDLELLDKTDPKTAKRLLESKVMTFNEVTWEVGYNDSSSFHKSFKLETGLTPNEYRLKFSIL